MLRTLPEVWQKWNHIEMILGVLEGMVVLVLMQEHSLVTTNQWDLHARHQMPMGGHLEKISSANSNIKDNGILELE
jgi:hypothetical protein